MTSSASFIRLPDLLEGWPMVRAINPQYEQVATESADWLEMFQPFDARYLAIFRKCNFGLLASLAYPNASPDHLRAACDMLNCLFLLDEISDRLCASDARKAGDVVMDSLRNPLKPRPEGENVLGVVFQSFWARASTSSSCSAANRFVEHVQAFVDAVVIEAADRDSNHLRNMDDYLNLRRSTIGVMPCFDILQMGMDLPDDVVNHPKIVLLVDLATDMLILANDIYSYNVERIRDDNPHNLVAVAMKDQDCDAQSAIDYIARCYMQLRDRFLAGFDDLPSWSSTIDKDVKSYIWGVGNWVTANIEWSFESERYFGTHGKDIRESRTIAILA
ncbi:terpenoid synthase [Sistotremastrum niveocremeum HHB9708]|uniref:Terpene synthase n=1 Tax=Sistotremastrum niveocremeum HHB9708 TaxID=1314777 RepID=A0A164MPY2_9AGAM|nr:terpenoid synthase [Sistotremastrum niveocremeum HHB9708]